MRAGFWSKATLAAGTMLGAFGAVPASALEEDLQDTIVVEGRRVSYGEPLTSSATKTETALRDVPQSVTVITDDLIEDQAMRSMSDVVRYVPGVSMGQGEGHRDAPTLRGNSSTADFYVDGVRDDVQYFRDLYNAERIEVLKGPNAMIFGRGGGGGVINRVTAWANWSPQEEVSLQVGSYEQVRAEVDFGATLSDTVALRLNGVYERSDSYRDYFNLDRWGVNPTGAFRLGPSTVVRAGYEHLTDERTVDRGVPSQNGRPWVGSRSAFFGNPDLSYATADVDLLTLNLDHEFSSTLSIRNHTVAGQYDKFYQNIHANSAVNGAGHVTLQAYNNATARENLFNQTDLVWRTRTGSLSHTVLIGAEIGRQETDNVRSANFAPGTVNVANPVSSTPVNFGASPLQTNSLAQLDLAAFYVQDQIALSPQWQIILGARFDRFDLSFDDRRPANADFTRVDEMISPRAGLIFRPIEPLSFYVSYSVSYLPQSGDQFASLTATTSALEPEEFENTEVGVKWDVLPNLALTAAFYRLDRTNTTAIDPITSLTVLTGAQRSEGFELGIAGSVTEWWEIVGGYAHQDVQITSTTTAAPAGRSVALTPEHIFSLWNMFDLGERWGVGLGATYQTSSFASISNAVRLPGFARVDASVQYALTENVELQLNVENLLNEEYWGTAHNDNNITPGTPTAARLTLRTRF